MNRNTLSWERCDICGRHGPVRECGLKPGLMVCPWCCLMCPERDNCPNPAWFPGLKMAKRKVTEGSRSRKILSYITDSKEK
ncbi:MAG: hypothetical protein F7B60_04330 [Desulfurococcales archaeon]|nr:hypothetical protein [Desulfurococcales archaeon]